MNREPHYGSPEEQDAANPLVTANVGIVTGEPEDFDFHAAPDWVQEERE